MKKFIYALCAVALVLGSMAIWGCNNGGGDEPQCDMTQHLPADELETAILHITSDEFGINGKCEISRTSDGGFKVVVLPSTDTRTPAASGAISVACN